MFSLFKTQTDFDLRFQHLSTVIVKVTHRCNLDCLYCYENITKKGEDMSEDSFKQLVDLTLENSQSSSVTFLFHGGEPTLLPNSWYENGIEYALKKGQLCRKKVSFSMQTNLLGLNESKIQLFKKYGIQLGISLDGPAMLLSTQRGGEDKVFNNFKRLQKEGIRAGVLMTINESNYEHFSTICHWLVNEAAVNDFKANVVTPVGRGIDNEMMSADKIFAAQYSILEYMIATEGKQLLEQNLTMEIKRFFAENEMADNLRNTLCHEKKCGAGSAVLGVTPEGNLLPCGRFTWDDASYFLGNIFDEKSLNKTYQNKFQKKVTDFHDLVPETWYDCTDCKAKKICGYGCQAFIVRSKQQANVDCLPTKMRYNFFEENKARLYPVYEQIMAKEGRGNNRKTLHFSIKDKNGQVKNYTV